MTTSQIAILIAATALGAFVKSVTGLGLPLIAIPIATLFAPQPTVVAALALPNLVQNATLVWQTRHARSDNDGLGGFLLAAVVGAVLGAGMVPFLPEWLLTLLLVFIVGGFLWSSTRNAIELSDHARRRAEIPIGLIAGFFQGSIGIAGPVVASWFQSVRLSRDAFVFAISATFGISGAVQVGVYATQGRLTPILPVALILLPVVLAFGPIGRRVRDRLDAKRFRTAVLTLIGVAWVLLLLELARDGVGLVTIS